MARSTPWFGILALAAMLAAPLLPAAAPAQEVEQKPLLRVVGRILSHAHAETGKRGVPNRWQLDLNDDLVADLQLYAAGEGDEAPAGAALAKEGVVAEAVVVGSPEGSGIYRLIGWSRIGLIH